MDYSGLRALYIDRTLERSPATSHTRGLAGTSNEDGGDIPAHGDVRAEWDAGRKGSHANPEHR